jgi:erythromycin esterase-like protein
MFHPTPADWIARDSIPFTPDAPEPAIDQLLSSLSPSVDLLAFGEPLHGGEDFLLLRNRLFQHLVQSHGYSAIAIESSFPRAHLVNDYIRNSNPASYDAVQGPGFSHAFGRVEANRELVEWMRAYNADPARPAKLRFYGFDSPTEMVGTDSPRQLLHLALDYLAPLDPALAQDHRQRIDPLLGPDADWENPAASFDHTKSIGVSPAAASLRIATEELLTDLHLRRPELIAKSDATHFAEAAHHASLARHLLNYHATLAQNPPDRIAKLLGIRDLMMADNLTHALAQERGRGKLLAHAHNSHLKRGQATWQLGPHALAWWPAGAHLHATLGPRYAVIGAALGSSEANGISPPEPNTLEHHLTVPPAPARFIPTHNGQAFTPEILASLSPRTGSTKNPTYFPLTPQSLSDFDALAVLSTTTYTRGGRPLQ